MNKNLYRIVFNKARNMFMAVAENVRSQSKAAGQSTSSEIVSSGQSLVQEKSFHQIWHVKALVASISLLVPFAPVYAAIVADSAANAANRAVIGAGKNSAGTTVPVVNIQTPKNGISHNIYKQFDVLAEGAVLNNSRTGATTKTVGTVGANPFLATGEARVILNEVNSTAASRFEGNLEVAGQMADVIIANPSGINIKGGGFINANKAIFTTGKPQLNADGSIKQFTVDQGKITVSANPNSKFGLGGNNNDANYVDLYTRALELSAELRAKNDIQVIAGANNVSADLQDVTAKTGTGTAPTLAVDVKALGGMYANNIYLMGTEKGLGVTNAGTLQAVNNLVITSAGKIEHSGTISSTSKTQGLVSLQTTGTGAVADINSSGSINSNSMLNIDSGNNLNVNVKEIIINNGSLASSPLMINTKGNLNLAANSRIFNDAQSGDVYIDAANINMATNAGITSNRGSAYIQSQKDVVAAQGAKLIAAQNLNVSGKGKLSLNGNQIQASLGSINLQADSSNTDGLIDIQGGTIYAGKDLNLYSSGDVNLQNLGFALENSATRVKNINGYSGRNLIWDNTAKALPQISGKVVLEAENNLALTTTGLSSKDSIQLQGAQLSLNSGLTSLNNISLTSEIADLVLSNVLNAQNSIDVAALTGSITTKSLQATSTGGKISLLAKKDLIINSVQTVVPKWPTDELTTVVTHIKGQKGIDLGSIGDGGVSIISSGLEAQQGDIQIISGNGLSILPNYDVDVSADDWYETSISSALTAQNIGINNKKGDLRIEDATLKATLGNLSISSDGKNTIRNVSLNSKGNMELFSKDHLTLQVVNANADKHMALNSKKNIYLNSGYGSTTTPVVWDSYGLVNLTAKGILSTTSADHAAYRTTYTGGAVSLEANNLISPSDGTLSFNTVDSTFLKNDPVLKDLNGDLTIQTNGALTIDPKIHKLNAIGDIELISKNGALTLKGYEGTVGNGSEQVVKLNTVGGGISLEGTKVDLQGAQLTAQKDIKLISSKEDIFIDGIKNKFTNFASIKYIASLNQNLADLNAKINIIKNDPSYLSTKDKIASLGSQASQINQLLNDALSAYTSGVDPLNASIGYDTENGNYIYVSNDDGGRAYFVSIPSGLDLTRYRQIVLNELPAENQKLKNFNNKINAFEQDKARVNQTINFMNNKTNGYEHAESTLTSKAGNISLTGARGVSISGANLTAAAGQVNIEARSPLLSQYTSSTINSGQTLPRTLSASIIIDGHTDFYDKGNETDANYSMRTFISPTIINGTKGVNIKTIGNTASDNLILQATGITASQGDVRIEANKSMLFDAAVEQSYDRSTSTTTKKSWGGLKKKITTTIEETNITNAASVDISGKNIYIETKKLVAGVDPTKPDNNIDIYSGRFTAEGGQISIKSGGNLNFYTAEETSSSKVDITKKSSFAGIKYNDSKTNATRTQISELPAVLKADYIGTKSGFDTRLVGTEFEYLKGAQIEAGGKIELLAATKQITDLVKKEKNSVVWQSMQDKGSITETAKLPSFNGPVAPTFKAAGGLVVQVPISETDANKVELRNEILKLANQPGNAYLKDFINRNDVNWQQILLAQKDWDYKSQGLTGAGAAILVIIVTVVTMGAGTAGAGAALFGTTTTTTTAMANAFVTSLTSQASVSLVNNGGDIGKTLKELGSKNSIRNLAASVVTAGLLSQVSTALNLKPDSTLLSDRLINNFTTSVGSTLVQTAINGGDLQDNLEKALLAGLAGALQGELASQIGTNLDKVDPNIFEYTIHKIAHAAVGCAAAAVTKSSCEAGAIGAGVGEIVAGLMPEPANGIEYTDAEKLKIRNIGKLVSGTVAAYTGYDVNTAANSADTAIQNNSLVRLATTTGKLLVKAAEIYGDIKKANKGIVDSKVFVQKLKDQGVSELVGIADDLVTVFGPASTPFDRALAAFDLIIGTDLKPGKAESLKLAQAELDKLKVDQAYTLKVLQVKKDVVTRNRLNGKEFEMSAASKLGVKRNTDRQMITIKTERDGQINIIPDAFGNGGTLVEFKNVQYLTDTQQLRGYGATGKPVTLVVNMNTKISETVKNSILSNKGTIQRFDPIKNTLHSY
ncbi:DUF637 domain-containing protein [Acinetobacter pittii]|uniref:Filamentous hemagglutinin N-terminal domain-containing protein n=7 Tax=Acinetobacter pittii TaxID=48296 RepID=A0AB37TCJ1_ACIPI|nr:MULTISPECIES: DUF637 domain-containing protein [Acinetobacter]KQF17216.1 hemagglutinin [Acinetobacter pittii]MBM0877596.1 DUF637 domain-containing protein [Acinetobacter pittii]MDQ9032327.1 DUF637 domain-containing protein [Acinetobacter pittii]MDQ9077303.1 DUF637 domain-containing protein [Acinetobacter pittii]RSO56228.1 filamentous hemagglutinin N-terminal domain-containing protein [Acinetobacter pittii]